MNLKPKQQLYGHILCHIKYFYVGALQIGIGKRHYTTDISAAVGSQALNLI